MAKYYRYTLKGRHSAEQAHAALGEIAAQGMIVRTDTNDGETHVVIAADTAPHAAHTLPAIAQAAGEIAEADVLRAP
jgi:hypothetical protein